MGSNKTSETKDIWRAIESVAKLLGGIGAVLGAVLIPLYLHKQTLEANLRADEDRKVQVYAQIMSQREAKDTDIRAKMFETLLSNYIEGLNQKNPYPALSVETEQEGFNFRLLNEKIIFLSILMENFMEYFSAGPLFEDLYSQISAAIDETRKSGSGTEVDELKALRTRLINMCKHFSSKEITMLSRMGLVSDKIAVRKGCESAAYIPLFEVDSRIADELSKVFQDPKNSTLCDQPSAGANSDITSVAPPQMNYF